MRSLAALVCLAALAFSASCGGAADQPTSPPNPADDVLYGPPNDFFDLSSLTTGYQLAVDLTTTHSGPNALVIIGNDPNGFGYRGIEQSVKADAYRGKRVRVSAWVKSTNAAGPQVGVWMVVDGHTMQLAADDMSDRPLRGTTDWHQVNVALDVPDSAIGITFGALMSGSGTLFVDDMTWDVVPADGPSTNLQRAPIALGFDADAVYAAAFTAPSNLNFDAPIPARMLRGLDATGFSSARRAVPTAARDRDCSESRPAPCPE